MRRRRDKTSVRVKPLESQGTFRLVFDAGGQPNGRSWLSNFTADMILGRWDHVPACVLKLFFPYGP